LELEVIGRGRSDRVLIHAPGEGEREGEAAPSPGSLAAERMDLQAKREIVKNGMIPSDWVCLDIGPETVKAFSEEIKIGEDGFLEWPMGVFENGAVQ